MSPKEKEKDWYGLEYAKAIYNASNRYGSRFFYGQTDFDSLTELAQGRQSVDSIRKLFGYLDANTPGNTGSEALAFLDIQVLNLAPKYINRAVAKMQKINYDVGLQAIDIVSVDEKAGYMAALETLVRMRDHIKRFRLDPKELFPELDIDSLPEYTDELLYELKTNPKIKKEIEGEETLKLIYAINNFHQKMREVDWDMTVYGRGHLHTYLDKNGVPRVDRINPKYWGGSYVENDDFEGQEYAFFFDFLSNNDFVRETAGQLTHEEQAEIIRQHSTTGANATSFIDLNRAWNYDGLGYIPVMKFYFRSEDNKNYVKRKNQYGSDILLEKGHNYLPSKDSSHRFEEGGDSKHIKNNYTSIYGGTWVIDSDCVYDYGRKKYPRTNLVDATLPIKTFATNFKEGRTVSFASQMIEPLYMVNVAWNKIKEILANGYMGVLEIDFNQIEDVALGQGGQVWKALDVMKFFFKKKILIKRGAVNKHEQKIGNAIDVNTGGLQLKDYVDSLVLGMNMLEQMTGTTIVESAEKTDRLAVGVMKASQMAGDLDLEYLYNGHEYLYQRTSHQLLLLAQQSKIDNRYVKYLVPSLGKYAGGYYNPSDDLAYCEYGLYLTRQPSDEQWALFYQQLTLAVEATLKGLPGGISLADSAYIMEIDNLKKARQILALRQEIFERKTAQNAQILHERQMEINQQGAQMATAGKLDEKKYEYELKGQLEVLKGQIQEKIQARVGVQQQQLNLFTDQNKRIVNDIQGKNKLIATAMETNVKREAIERRPDRSPED